MLNLPLHLAASTSKHLPGLIDLCLKERCPHLARLLTRNYEVAKLPQKLLVTAEEPDAISTGGALRSSVALQSLLETPRKLLPPGAELGPYEIVKLLGEGGSSDVYAAKVKNARASHQVALKLEHDASAARLHHEKRVLLNLNHASIVRLIDHGTASGRAYLALECINGLDAVTAANRRRASLDCRMRWILALCDALAHAHARGVIHCDIKPSNVLIDHEGRLHLVDFGIAQLFRDLDPQREPGEFTPGYAAPEQQNGRPLTEGVDIFQVGLLLSRLIVGKPLRSRTSHCRNDAPTPEPLSWQLMMSRNPSVDENVRAMGHSRHSLARLVEGDLDSIVLKCLSPLASQRYTSVLELMAKISDWLDFSSMPAATTI